MASHRKKITKPDQFLKFPSEHTAPIYKKQVLCVKCLEMVNPHYFMVCKAKSHLLCGKCAWVEEPSPPSPCCDPENLVKGNVNRLEEFLNNVKWHCLYRKSGCQKTIKQDQWTSHVNDCKFRSEQQCFYYGCKVITNGLDDTIKHYANIHFLMEMKMEHAKHKFNVIYDESDNGMKRRLAVLKDKEKYYLFASEVTEHDLNFFIWDLQQNTDNMENEAGSSVKYRIAVMPTAEHFGVGQLHYFGSCQPMSRPSMDIIKNGDCFSIGLARLKMKFLFDMPQCDELKMCQVEVSLKDYQVCNIGSKLKSVLPLNAPHLNYSAAEFRPSTASNECC